MLFSLFLLLLLSPCVVAFVHEEALPSILLNEEWTATWRPKGRRPAVAAERSVAIDRRQPEGPVFRGQLAEDFVIRSFPKGLRQRRILLQDGCAPEDRAGSPRRARLHIVELRARIDRPMSYLELTRDGWSQGDEAYRPAVDPAVPAAPDSAREQRARVATISALLLSVPARTADSARKAA